MHKYLPEISIKGLVSSIRGFKRFVFSLNTYYLIPNTIQKGFALIPLLILMVVGIAAGTILIQNGVNFLPKAQQQNTACYHGNVMQLFDDELTDPRNKQLKDCLGQGQICDSTSKDCRNPKDKAECDALNTNVYYIEGASGRRCVINGTTACQALGDAECAGQGKNCIRNDNLKSGFECVAKSSTELSSWSPIDDNAFRIKFASTCYTHATGKSVRDWVVKRGSTLVQSSTGDCDAPNRPCTGLTSYCSGEGQQCVQDDNFQAHCGSTSQPAAAPAAAQQATGQAPWIKSNDCTQDQKTRCASDPKEPKDGCAQDYAGKGWCLYEERRNGEKCNEDTHGAACKRVYGPNTECIIIDRVSRCIVSSCTSDENTGCSNNNSTCTVGTKNLNNKEYKYTYCGPKTGAPAPAAAGAPGPQAGAPATATQPRSGPESAQKAGSFDNKVAAVDCPNPAHKLHCETYYKEHGLSNKSDARCYIINGHPRCMYEKNFSSCSSSAEANDVGACRQKGGCLLEKVTVGSTQYQFSRCTDDSSGFSSNSSSATTGTTGCESLKDAEGLTIPCYKIGVFTPEELKATEAQAKVALERYTQYKRIIDETRKDVDEKIRIKAEEKIKEAERLANACLARN